MTIAISAVRGFAQQQVDNGNAVSVQEAEKQIASCIAEAQLEEALTQGRDDIEAGRYRIVNETTNKELLKELEKKVLSNQN